MRTKRLTGCGSVQQNQFIHFKFLQHEKFIFNT
ncbi:MAG: hypothetical protein ACI9V1_002322, partial [Spirosomataceae bacterium]